MFIKILCDTKSKVLQKSKKYHLLLLHLTQILINLKMSTNAFSVVLISSSFFSFFIAALYIAFFFIIFTQINVELTDL